VVHPQNFQGWSSTDISCNPVQSQALSTRFAQPLFFDIHSHLTEQVLNQSQLFHVVNWVLLLL